MAALWGCRGLQWRLWLAEETVHREPFKKAVLGDGEACLLLAMGPWAGSPSITRPRFNSPVGESRQDGSNSGECGERIFLDRKTRLGASGGSPQPGEQGNSDGTWG